MEQPVPSFAKWLEIVTLENPIRWLVHNPYTVLEVADVRPGMKVLDIGCGTGYLSIPAAELVGSAGHVFAVDVDEIKLSILKRKAEKRGLENLTTVKAEAWSMSHIQPATIDVALMFYSLHHFEKLNESLKEAVKKLKGGGMLLIHDPIRSRLAGHGTKIDEVVKVGTDAGLHVKSLRKRVISYSLEMVKP